MGATAHAWERRLQAIKRLAERLQRRRGAEPVAPPTCGDDDTER